MILLLDPLSQISTPANVHGPKYFPNVLKLAKASIFHVGKQQDVYLWGQTLKYTSLYNQKSDNSIPDDPGARSLLQIFDLPDYLADGPDVLLCISVSLFYVSNYWNFTLVAHD